jgi:hypothetical protein
MTLPPPWPDCLVNVATGVLVRVVVQPRAARNELSGVHQDALKLRLTAPPVEGAANRDCLRFLASLLGVPATCLDIVRGAKSRRKTVLVRGADAETVAAALERHWRDSRALSDSGH